MIREGAKLFRGNPELLAFTPTASYLYFHHVGYSSVILPSSSANYYIFLMVLSAIVNAYVFNYIIGSPSEPGTAKSLFAFIFVTHIILLLHISVELFIGTLNGKLDVYGEILLLVVLIHISIIATHRLISWLSTNGYERSI